MPVTLGSTDRKLVLGAAAGFILVTLLAALFSGQGGNDARTPPTTYSTSSNGTMAAFLLAKESGWNAERWEHSPEELPNRRATYVLAEPEQLPTAEEREHIAEFVRQGGRLVIAGLLAPRFLPFNAMSYAGPQYTWARHDALAPSRFTAAPKISMRDDAYWNADKGLYVPLYGGSADKSVAVAFPYGKGEIIWWAAATPMTNNSITEPGNLEFFLACMGNGKREVLFDEYFHGHRPGQPLSATGLVLWWMLAQFALFAVAVVLTFSRRSTPIQAPKAESRLSPLEFVETLGGLYERARATKVPVAVAYQRFRYRLTRRLGLPVDTPVNVIEKAAAELLAYQNPNLGETMRACEAASDSATAEQALALVQSLQTLGTELKLLKPH